MMPLFEDSFGHDSFQMFHIRTVATSSSTYSHSHHTCLRRRHRRPPAADLVKDTWGARTPDTNCVHNAFGAAQSTHTHTIPLVARCFCPSPPISLSAISQLRAHHFFRETRFPNGFYFLVDFRFDRVRLANMGASLHRWLFLWMGVRF